MTSDSNSPLAIFPIPYSPTTCCRITQDDDGDCDCDGNGDGDGDGVVVDGDGY